MLFQRSFTNCIYLSQKKEWSSALVNKLKLSFLVINPLPSLDMCTMAQLKSIPCHAFWEIMFVGLLFLPNVPICFYTFFTAYPQERTSLVETLV